VADSSGNLLVPVRCDLAEQGVHFLQRLSAGRETELSQGAASRPAKVNAERTYRHPGLGKEEI
jgi:hypothetical protein